MADFTSRITEDGVAIITWDVMGRSMNVMSEEGFTELSDCVDQALGDEAVKGIVITSGKSSFAGGMDLNIIANLKQRAGDNPAKGVFDGIMKIHSILRKIERAGMDKKNKGGKPIAAALPGTALGIGLELPLACHRIFVADDRKAKIGLPEILVGIFPGAGGTTRLSRKIGLMPAGPLLSQGKLCSPSEAKNIGVIDEVVPAGELLERAKAWVLGAGDADIVKPWDQKGYRFPGGAPYHPAGYMTYVGAAAIISGAGQGAYPAAEALMSALYEAAMVPFDTALKIEARWFTNVLMNPSSSAMIRTVFINKEKLEKGANRPELPDEKVRKLGVLGAGMMGAGIALVSARAGIKVVILDQTLEAAQRGKAYTENFFDKRIKKKKSVEQDKIEALGRIHATADVEDLVGCDLIIEAVFEDVAVKAEITQRVEAVIGKDAIFATNTSTLPISQLAEASQRPEQFIGIHFFSPVERMALVEIIRGKKSGDRAVAKALDFVRQIRKTPIVVNDSRFFYANRCIIPYLNEGIRMVGEGVEPALIEAAARMLGFPVGPLQLVDETSLELAQRIILATREAMGEAYNNDAVDEVVFWMMGEGRAGRKAGKGFYVYDETGRRQKLWANLREQYPTAEKQPELTEVQHRLLFAQVLEAVRAKEEGVLMDIREGDVGAILGWGFAPASGGPFAWLDIVGVDWALERAEELAQAHGPRFDPPKLLRDLAGSKGVYAMLDPKAA